MSYYREWHDNARLQSPFSFEMRTFQELLQFNQVLQSTDVSASSSTVCMLLPAARWIPRRPRPSVAAPGRQDSQVISRSLRPWGRSSGANTSAVKELGHFEVRKSSISQVAGCNFFLKKVDVRYVIVRPFVACLSETFVHHTQAIEFFGNVSMPFGTMAIYWHPGKILHTYGWK